MRALRILLIPRGAFSALAGSFKAVPAFDQQPNGVLGAADVVIDVARYPRFGNSWASADPVFEAPVAADVDFIAQEGVRLSKKTTNRINAPGERRCAASRFVGG